MMRYVISAVLCIACMLAGCTDSMQDETPSPLTIPAEDKGDVKPPTPQPSIESPDSDVGLERHSWKDTNLPGDPEANLWYDPSVLKVDDVRKVIVEIVSYGDCVPIRPYLTVRLTNGASTETIELVGEGFIEYTPDMQHEVIGTHPGQPPQYAIKIPETKKVSVQFRVLAKPKPLNPTYEIAFRQSIQENDPHELPQNEIRAHMGNKFHQGHWLNIPLAFQSASDE